MVISLTEKWDVKSRVAMFFQEWNECKNLQRDFDSPILSWGQNFFYTGCKKTRPLGLSFLLLCRKLVISLTKKWDVKSQVAMFFQEWNECKNLQRDFDSPILSWGQNFFTHDARKRDL